MFRSFLYIALLITTQLHLSCTGSDESIEDAPPAELQLLALQNETLWIQETTAANPYRVRLRNNLKEGFMIDAQTCEWIKEGIFSYRGFRSETAITEHSSRTLALKISSSNSDFNLELNYRMEITGDQMDFRLESNIPTVVSTFEGKMYRSEARAQNMCKDAD